MIKHTLLRHVDLLQGCNCIVHALQHTCHTLVWPGRT